MSKTAIRGAAAACALFALSATSAFAGEQYLGANGLALSGFDPVAYFTVGEPVEGSPEFTTTYNDATFQFSSAETLAMFEEAPERFAPAFDGHCAYGAAVNYKVPGNPQHWSIIDNTLYLNVSAQADVLFKEDIPGHLASAENNWVSLEPQPAADPQ